MHQNEKTLIQGFLLTDMTMLVGKQVYSCVAGIHTFTHSHIHTFGFVR